MSQRDEHVEVVLQLLANLDAARLARAVRHLEDHEVLRVRLVLEAAEAAK